MTRLLLALGLALALAGVTLWAWDDYVAAPYIAQGEQKAARAIADDLEQHFGRGIRTPLAAAAVLKEQASAVDRIADLAQKRIARAEAAARAKEADIAKLAGRVQQLLAEQPAFPNDPCASACRLLAQPL